MRRTLIVLMALLGLAGLAGCTGLPVSGQVKAGRAVNEVEVGPDVRIVPDGPQPGASPEEIVDGFLRAGAGSSGDWAIARQFLAPSIRETWNPSEGVTIVPTGEIALQEVAEDTVTLSLDPTATVDASGHYELARGATAPLAFGLVEIDGQWRISRAADGIVLDESVFITVFHRYSVMYFDPSWTYLVPDQRWFPTSNAAVRIAGALIDEHLSDWLQGAVKTAFPDDVTFVWSSVPITAGTAQVELSPEVLALDSLAVNRMAAQLDASLATAGITDVQLTVNGTPLDATPVQTRSTAVTGSPLVLTAQGFGFLSGTELSAIPGLSGAVAGADPVAVQVGPDRDQAAVRSSDGAVSRATKDGQVIPLDNRAGLLDPAIDPLGFVWSIPGQAPGAMTAFGRTDHTELLTQSWAAAGATSVQAIAISRDGTRMAGVVRVGAATELWLSGVIRDANGTPTRLGEPFVAGVLTGTAVSMTWSDDATVAVVVVGSDEPRLVEQIVGGGESSVAGPAGAVVTTVASATSSIRLRSDAGALFLRRGANWLQVAEGIDLLAVQQGSPK